MESVDPKISILLPVYNAAPYLEACLDSIVEQTEKNWELLAVNDFSEDESREILDKYARADKRIRVFDNVAKGIIPALRLAYEKSNGNLITRMDADDLMVPEKLTELKTILVQNKRGHLATGKVKYFSENELGGGYLRYEHWLNSLTESNAHFSEIYRECVVPSPVWMLWRDDLDASGAFLPDTYPEDYDLVFRFYQNDLKPVSSSKVLHYWRDHNDRSSRNDPNYANQQYFSLKLPWFLKLDRNSNRPLVIWGAGKKGKQVARMLWERKLGFYWICNSPSKWGHKHFGVTFESIEKVWEMDNPQILILVGNPEDQAEITAQLEQNGKIKGQDFYFFC